MTTTDVSRVSKQTLRRFKRAKHRSQDRQGCEELTHDEFLNQLLDVWELHEARDLEAEAEAEADATVEVPA